MPSFSPKKFPKAFKGTYEYGFLQKIFKSYLIRIAISAKNIRHKC